MNSVQSNSTRNVQQNINRHRQAVIQRKSKLFALFFIFIFIFFDSFYLFKYGSKSNCSDPINEWLLGHLIIYLLYFIMITYSYINDITIENIENFIIYRNITTFLSNLITIWYIIGSVLYFNGNCNITEPLFSKYIFGLVILFFIFTFLPIFLCCSFLLCFPCFSYLIRLADRFEDYSQGATDEEIDRIPDKIYRKSINKNDTNSFNETDIAYDNQKLCSICIEDYNDGNNIKILPCKHNFHSNCIKLWFKKKFICPDCRRVPEINI